MTLPWVTDCVASGAFAVCAAHAPTASRHTNPTPYRFIAAPFHSQKDASSIGTAATGDKRIRLCQWANLAQRGIPAANRSPAEVGIEGRQPPAVRHRQRQ